MGSGRWVSILNVNKFIVCISYVSFYTWQNIQWKLQPTIDMAIRPLDVKMAAYMFHPEQDPRWYTKGKLLTNKNATKYLSLS